MITHYDHTYTYLVDNDLNRTLQRFKDAGFLTIDDTVRHPMGMLTGFASLTGGYLEFVSIVDEKEFEEEANSDHREFRSKPQPFGLGAVCTDPAKVFERLSPRYPDLKAPYSRAEKDRPQDPPIWTFCTIPDESTPGAHTFALKYLTRKPGGYELKEGPNSIFAIEGFVFCSNAIEERIMQWEQTLSLIAHSCSRSGRQINFGVQLLEWIDPDQYKQSFGSPWEKRESPNGEVCAVRLLARSIEKAKQALEHAGFKTLELKNAQELIVPRDSNTGYAFIIKQASPEAFLSRLNQTDVAKTHSMNESEK